MRCLHRAYRILKDNIHLSHSLFTLLPSDRRYKSICYETTRLLDSSSTLHFPKYTRLRNVFTVGIPTVPTKLGAYNCPTSICWSIQSSLLPSPAPEISPHTIILTKLYTWHNAVSHYRSPGNRQTQTRPSDCQMEKRDLSLQRTRLHCSRVQWRCALHHCIRRFALHLLMYGLDAAARPWKPIPWSSLRTVLELIWRPHEVWRSVVIDSAESWRPLHTMSLGIHWPSSVILCGLHGWVAVIPNHFHFVIMPLTVDCGIFRREEISRLDLLHRWHPITVAGWNSLSSWEWPIIS